MEATASAMVIKWYLMAYFSASERASKGLSTIFKTNAMELLASEAILETYSLLTLNASRTKALRRSPS